MEIMKEHFIKYIVNFLPELLIGFLFIFFQFQNINLDFWNDEIYTLKHFTFISIPQIFLDYHVPNNHILFNLINHLYLSLIGVDTLFQLMNHPYLLRVVPLVYSGFTLIFAYKTAKKTHSRTAALLASIILITTIPFLNFSLQIRGYGLSMLLLNMVVYYGISYLKKPQRKSLIFVGIITTLLVYTIPSNLYFVFSILLVYGILFLKNLIKIRANKTPFSFSKIISEVHFRLIFSSTLGLILAIILYTPIFKDVFMNEYVTGGPPFDFGKLRFYIPHLFEAIVSGRWLILAIAIIGFLLKVISREKWTFPIFIYLSLLMIPIMLVYFRGDRPPLRVFVVILPFTSILIANGILQLWKKVKQLIPLHDYYLIFGIIIYSVFMVQIENQKINQSVLTDIQMNNRSQDLYRQYYSHHYQPLLDIGQLSMTYKKNNLPILIYGCEPHGVPNYLNKFKLPYYTKSNFDSLLSTNDSLYIITNTPSYFTGLEEYHATPLNNRLTYNTTILLEKRTFVKNVVIKIDSLQQQFGDSVGFVFNSFRNENYSDHLKPKSFFSITEETQLGDLISFSKQKKYLCYLFTLKHNSAIYHTIVNDKHRLVQEFNSGSFSKFQLLEIDTNFNTRNTNSEKLNDQITYSTAYNYTVDVASSNITFKVSFRGEFIKNSQGIIVLSIDRKREPILWNGQVLNKFYQSNTNKQTVITAFDINTDLLPGDQIKIYVWNAKKEAILVNDFQVELVSQ
jgi:hypothetical protein